MPEPFKNLINTAGVREAARHLARVSPDFDRARFERHATSGLDALELKARAMQVADALEAALPDDFAEAAAVIEAALAPMADAPAAHSPGRSSLASGGDALPQPTGDGLSGWIGWPLGEFIARRGR
jgi:hypothetical protein